MARLHPYSAAVDALRGGGQLAVFALFAATASVGMGGGGGGGGSPLGLSPGLVAAAVPLAFLAGASVAVARWYRFEYHLGEEHLIVTSGVVGRQEREIPLRRVQNVDVRRSLLQRALGLATVRVETAGGGSTEATLDAVSTAEADRLREELGRRARRAREGTDAEGDPAASSSTDPAAAATGPDAGIETDTDSTDDALTTDAEGAVPDAETLYELTGRRFATLCAVSFRPGAVFAPVVGASLFDDVLFDGTRLLVRLGVIDVDVGPGDVPTPDLQSVLTLGLLGLAGFLLVVWLASALLTFVRYYGFRLERVGDELRYERGLLGRYSGTVPLSKVQTVTVSENAAMRRLGYASLTVETAGYAPGSNGDGSGAETTVPLDERERVVALADEVRAELGDGDSADPTTLDRAFETDVVERPPVRARRRYVARYALAALAVAALAVGLDRLAVDLPRYAPLLPLVGVLAAPLAGHLTWLHRGHATVEDGVVTRSGVLRRHTRLVPSFRLQTVVVSRSVFQRRRELGSVVADTASSSGVLGGDAVAHDLDERDADSLREDLLARLKEDLLARRRRRGRGATAAGEATAASESSAESDEGTDRSFDWVGGGNGGTAGSEGESESETETEFDPESDDDRGRRDADDD